MGGLQGCWVLGVKEGCEVLGVRLCYALTRAGIVGISDVMVPPECIPADIAWQETHRIV